MLHDPRPRFTRLTDLARRRRRHDHRHLWAALTERLRQSHGQEEIARELADYIIRVLDATSAAVYLTEDRQSSYQLSTGSGRARFVQSLTRSSGLPSWFEHLLTAGALPAGHLALVTTTPLESALGAPLRWRDSVLGFIVIEPRRGGRGDGAEDLELLATVAGQAAPVIMAARLSELERTPPRFAAFDRSTAAVIHDLKNSVSALSLLARNAPGNLGDPEFQRDALVTLSRTIDRMRRAVAALSTPDAAPPSDRPEAIDLRELIIEATTPFTGDARIRLVRQLQPVNTMYCDRDALFRVVENLTTNAAEAIDDEGTVTVTLAEEQGQAVISVNDTGCGMSEEYQEHHLFSPFRSTKKGGWGIGLHQTKQVVEHQYGEILVKSVEGHGTTFTVKLPLRADAESPCLESVR